MRTKFKTGEFYYSKSFRSAGKVIECEMLWGSDYVRIWLPKFDAVARVIAADLSSFSPQSSALSTDQNTPHNPHYISYISAAAKVSSVLEQTHDERSFLLALMEPNVMSLPHQIHALSKAISGDRVRYLSADEVGLYKTIEAGLVMGYDQEVTRMGGV